MEQIDWSVVTPVFVCVGNHQALTIEQMVNNLERHMALVVREADDMMLGLDESQYDASATTQELERRLRGRDGLYRRRKLGN